MKNQYKKPNQLRAFLVMMRYFFLAMTRNPATFAFGFLFPVVFISIFGLIGNTTPAVTIGLPSGSNLNNPIIKSIKAQTFVKTEEGSQSQLETKLKQDKLSGIITVEQTSQTPPHYTIKVITSQA